MQNNASEYSNRTVDRNGWVEIKGNPITAVGVFPYRGFEINAPQGMTLEPDKIYYALRPEEELNNVDAIKSFQLIPFIDEHELLAGKGVPGTPVEKKGMHGTTGQDVYFEYPHLKANVKIMSEGLTRDIESGKRGLSVGYDCRWEYAPGVFEGANYDFIQRDLRGNQLALVDRGRSGDSVVVLDSRSNLKFVFDTAENLKMSEESSVESKVDELVESEKAEAEGEAAEAVTLASIVAEIKKIQEYMATVMDKPLGEAVNADMNSSAESRTEDEDVVKKVMDSPAAKKVMDAAIDSRVKNSIKSIMGEVSQRDALAVALSDHTGVFSHKEMTHLDVAKYGIKKLNLVCDSGAEVATVNGYLQGCAAKKMQEEESYEQATKLPESLAKYNIGV